MTDNPKISAVVPVGARHDDIAELAREYVNALDSTGSTFELIFVIDGNRPAAFDALEPLARDDTRVRIIKFAKAFGEATALAAGFKHVRGEHVVTLPAYFQIRPDEIPKLLSALDDCDMVVAHRWPRAEKSAFERWRRDTFHWLIAASSGERFQDLGCAARAFRRSVIDELTLYGDQHLFLPLLASKQGFRIREVKVAQSERDRFDGRYRLRSYLHRALDIFSVVFLVRFTKKPIRFFGMIGSITFLIGAVVLAVLVGDRLFMGTPLADRPALLVSSLLTVLGLQIFALGLLGELIIFTHAREMKEYTIERIVN